MMSKPHAIHTALVTRICIAGGPRTGKTTLSHKLMFAADGHQGILHTDDLIGSCGWSEASAQVAQWMDEPGPWIVEGVAVPRALRKWLGAHPMGKPCDVLHWLEEPKVPRTLKQDAMAAGCRTVFDEILSALLDRGVLIEVEGGAAMWSPSPLGRRARKR